MLKKVKKQIENEFSETVDGYIKEELENIDEQKKEKSEVKRVKSSKPKKIIAKTDKKSDKKTTTKKTTKKTVAKK